MNLASFIDESLLSPSKVDTRYDGGPFQYAKNLPPRSKGKFFEETVKSVLSKTGKKIDTKTSSGHDLIVNGAKIGVIGSMLNWNDDFGFMQIRPNNDFDSIYFALFYPREMFIMTMGKKTVKANVDNGSFVRQHGGMKDSAATYSFVGNKDDLISIGAIEYGW